jgi:choline dehydrogenase
MGTRWDLIVVGAGSAGAAIAARCAEAGQRVLLVEAGPDYRSAEMPEAWRSPNPLRALLDPESSVDFLWHDLLASRTDVQEPQLYWRGRGVGGSSAINGQIAIRPPREDYDDWAIPSWSWDDVLPFYRRLEQDVQFGDRAYHGDRGPIPIWRAPRESWGSVDDALARSALAGGFEWAEDLNAPGATGVSPYPINSRDQRRVTTNDGYLEAARELESLSILGDALVDRVLFDNGRAVGIELLHAGGRRQEHGEEIVLCAGVIHSPCILVRSGVGPASRLAELGVEVVADLPVGRDLQDHPMIAVALPLTAETAIKTPDDRHTNCCVRHSSGDREGCFNDMMLVSLNQQVLAMEHADTRFGAGAIGVWGNQTFSRGEVIVVSRDPAAQPVVREGMLADERDVRRMRAGVRLLAEIVARDEVASICSTRPEQANPELWSALEDDASLDAFMRANAADTQHGTSTCRIGAVVDEDCCVLGVPGLRVADASVFPAVPRANTNLATIAIGELVAARLAS